MLARLDPNSARFWLESPARHSDYKFIIKPQDDQLYIVRVNNRRHDKFIITNRITSRGNHELEFAGAYNVTGQYTEGYFTIEENGEIVAFRGTSRNITVPETIAGITVRSMDRGLFRNHPDNVIRLPPSIRFFFGDFGTRVTIIIDSDIDLRSHSSFERAYNSNGRRGGIYTLGWNNNTRTHEWSFEPFY